MRALERVGGGSSMRAEAIGEKRRSWEGGSGVGDGSASARKKCALGEAALRPDAANPPGTPRAPGASGYWLHRTVDPWCVQIMVAWQPAPHCLLKGAFLGE